MKNILYLFCFFYISKFIISICESETENDLSNCTSVFDCCFNSITGKCITLNNQSYYQMKEDFNKLKNDEDPKVENTYFEDIQCNTVFEKCRQINSNDIKENCYKINNEFPNGYECCYMTLNFDENKKHECYPAPPDKDEIKKIINQLKGEYDGIKSIKIKCNKSQYINFGVFILFNILFLF